MTSCGCYRPNPANINLHYVSGVGLVVGSDGCGGVFIIPQKGSYEKAIGYLIGGREMPVLDNIAPAVAQLFDGAQIMFNNNMRQEEFAAFSIDGNPHEYRMITLVNLPFQVLQNYKWEGDDQHYKGAVAIIRVDPSINTSTGAALKPDNTISYHPIIWLNAAEWKAFNTSS